MKVEQLKETLADNVERIIESQDLASNKAVEQKTDVSKAQVYNIRKQYNAATLRSLARFSEGFGIPPWALIHPNGLDIYTDPRLADLIDAYCEAGEDARQVILAVAKSQSALSPR